MTVQEILYDIVARLDDVKQEKKIQTPRILRAMNRVYQQVLDDINGIEKKMIMAFSSRPEHTATVSGYQEGVNTIAIDTGHTVITGDTVFNVAWLGGRNVTSHASAQIIIDGLPVTIDDDSEIKTAGTSWPLPGDFKTVLGLSEQLDYRAPEYYDTVCGIYSIIDGDFTLGAVAEDLTLEMTYNSSGFELVTKATASLSAGEANQPEWQWRSSDQLLIYGTCLELGLEYRQEVQDRLTFERLKSRLIEKAVHRQELTPPIMGGYGRYDNTDDPYEQPGSVYREP